MSSSDRSPSAPNLQTSTTETAAPKAVITMTITGVPVSFNGKVSIADAVVTVDFAQVAVQRIANAVYSDRKQARLLRGAVVVRAVNHRDK